MTLNSDEQHTLDKVRRRCMELENENRLLERSLRHERERNDALVRDIKCPECAFIRRNAPMGSILRECYETGDEFVILGDPGDDETHNCDAMGCSTLSHVVLRVSKHAKTLAEFRERLARAQRNLDPEVQKIINDNFWDLV